MGRRLAPIALALVALALLPGSASAVCTQVARHVTTTSDVVDPSDGQLSLREAIAAANADPSTFDCEDVLLPAGHYVLTAGPLTITTQNIVLVAPDAESTTVHPSSHDVVIDGGGAVTLFVADAMTDLQIQTLTLANGNRALVNSGTIQLSRMTISGNQAAGNGGAILNNAGGTAYLQESTVIGNHTSGGASGGAVMNSGGLYISATTFVGNRVDAPGNGGAIYNAGTVSVTHSTLNDNTAASGRDVYNEGGKVAQTQDSLYASGCNVKLTPVGAEGLSISSDGTCADTTGDLKLGPLQDNGGATDTEMLLPGSPAIDAYTTQCSFGYDEREVHTPQGPLCDVGAYELVESGDLAIQAPTASAALQTGTTTSLGFLVSSLGPASDASLAFDAIHPTVTIVLPTGLSFAGSSTGCTAVGQTVTCDVGKVTTNGPAVPVGIDVRADAAGTFQATAAAASPRPDVSPLDDQATVTVTATAPPPPPQATVTLVGKPKVSGDRVRLTLACSGAPCAGDVRVLVKERLRHHRVVAVLARTSVLGRKAFSIAAGQRRTITLRLSKSGRALRKRFRLPARLTIRLTTPKTTAASAAIVFKRHR